MPESSFNQIEAMLLYPVSRQAMVRTRFYIDRPV